MTSLHSTLMVQLLVQARWLVIANEPVTSNAKPDTEKPNLTCPICSKVCRSKSGLESHMKVHKRLEQKHYEESSTSLINETCEKVACSYTPHITGTSTTEVQRHCSSIRVGEPAILVQPPSSVPPSGTNTNPDTEKPNLSCPLCAPKFKPVIPPPPLPPPLPPPTPSPTVPKQNPTIPAPPPPPKFKRDIPPTATKFNPLLPQEPTALMSGLDFSDLRRKALERRQRLGIEYDIVENSPTEVESSSPLTAPTIPPTAPTPPPTPKLKLLFDRHHHPTTTTSTRIQTNYSTTTTAT
ncbi:uncharacterized protein [Palaemon carinicauda]|uniref:uncharacterized protein n=1 Tax=Palaemon carinicauda TaxID=392227 RepID=UPI0035B5BC11